MMTLDQLAGMRGGALLEVIADCAAARVNIPIEIARHSHRLVREPTVEGAELIFLIEVGKRPRHVAERRPVPEAKRAGRWRRRLGFI